MPFEKFLLAAPVALAALLVPTLLSAETLRILRGDPSAAIKVLPGSKVIVESDLPIEMVSIADPQIADVSLLVVRHIAPTGFMTGRFLPDNKVALSGLEIGRTTLMLYVGGNLWSIFEVLVTHDALETAKSDPVTVPDMLTPAELPVIDGEASATVSVPSSGAIMIESDIRFENGAAKDPNSIFLIMETPQMIYVVGNEPGVTTLTLLRGDGGDETRIRIEVTPNMDGIE